MNVLNVQTKQVFFFFLANTPMEFFHTVAVSFRLACQENCTSFGEEQSKGEKFHYFLLIFLVLLYLYNQVCLPFPRMLAHFSLLLLI